MRRHSTTLRNFPIMLSASLPEDLIGTSRAQDLFDAIVAVVGGVFSADGSLIFGGHPSITPLVHHVASAFKFKEPRIKLFQLARFRETVPPEVYDDKIFGEVIWIEPKPEIHKRSIEDDLRNMRRQMVRASRAGVFIGGKTGSFFGPIPGIRDEFQQFLSEHPSGPVYLLGFLGGEVQQLIRSMKLNGSREPNRLNDEELSTLHNTDDIDFATSLIFADLRRYATQVSLVAEENSLVRTDDSAPTIEISAAKSPMLGIDAIRNIGIIADIDAKTTTTECLIYYTDIRHEYYSALMHEISAHERTELVDWIEQEQYRGLARTNIANSGHWERNAVEHRINIIDTPAHVDFLKEVARSLRVLDGAVAVVNGVAGVEPRSETLWRQADKYGVPRICFINNLDRAGASFERSFESIFTQLGAHPVALQIPIGVEDQFKGVIDLIAWQCLIWDESGAEYETVEIPADLLADALAARERLVEAVAGYDDALMEKYLEGEEISEREIRAVLRNSTIGLKIVPVVIGSAFKNIGVQTLLDAVVDYLPSPLDISAIEGTNPNTGEVERRPADASAPFAGLVFKTLTDKDLKEWSFVRIYSGTIKARSSAYNPIKKTTVLLRRLMRMHANKLEEIESASAGEIIAIDGLTHVTTGDTLCDDNKPIVLEAMDLPLPVIRVAVAGKTRLDHDKLAMALNLLVKEDPSVDISSDRETGETIIAGSSELQLEIIVDRIRREFGADFFVGQPQVVYRETITQAAHGKEVYKKQTGGRGHYGHVEIEVEPAPGEGFVFINEIKEGALPREYIKSVEHGVKDVVERGFLAGYKIVDIKVRLVAGSYHEVDSDERSFHIAGSFAFHDAVEKATPILLEPIMQVEVVTPSEYSIPIMGQLNARRARIESTETRVGGSVIKALVPLAEMFGFSEDLHSATGGRAAFTMYLDVFAQVPAAQTREVIGKRGSVEA